jgi:hypothetical protein
MAMELCYRYSNDKQKEIGAIFGVDYRTARLAAISPLEPGPT